MTGVIWIVQIVTYPQLRLVPDTDFRRYEQSHMRRIGFVVGPAMLLELVTALFLWIQKEIPQDLLLVFYISLGLGVMIAVSTALVQAPLHGQLAKEGKVDRKIEILIQSNWIRTICWSGRSLCIGYIIYSSLSSTTI